MDTHPTKTLIRWLEHEALSIRLPDPMEHKTDIGELKARIAAGEYSLDAGAIAEAMFGRADREGDSEMLEAGERDGAAGGVDDL